MTPNDHRDELDISLESILDEYRGFDPEAPESVPMPEAAFASKVAEAELVDSLDGDLLTPEMLLALQEELEAPAAAPEPEPEPEPEPLPPEDEPEEDVREYTPHSELPPDEPEDEEPFDEQEAQDDSFLGRFPGLKRIAQRFSEIIAPEEEEDEVPLYAPVEPESEPLLADLEAEPDEEPTQVFQAVAEVFGEEAAPAEEEAPVSEEELPVYDEETPAGEAAPEYEGEAPAQADDWAQEVADAFGEDLTLDLPEDEKIWTQGIDGEEDTQYAAAPEELPEEEPADYPQPDMDFSDHSPETAEYEDDDEYENVEQRSFREAVIRPLVERIASISVRLRERGTPGEAEPEEDLGPEPTPRQAHRYYAAREAPLQTRFRLSLLVSLILLYLSSGLPVLGLLRNSPRVMALMCIVLQLTVMLIGLDVLTPGLTGFKQKRPGIASLVMLSCVFSLIDGVLCVVMNDLSRGLPYCVVSAFAVTFLLYSSYCRARGYGLTFYVLSRSATPGMLTAGLNEFCEGITLSKAQRSADGFVHRAEEPGPDEILFSVLTPYLIIVAAILSLLATVLSGSIKNAAHIFAAVFAAAAPLAGILSFAVPFRSLAAFLRPKGLAVAGWSGASDIGRSKRFVVTDQDLFDRSCIRIGEPVFDTDESEAKTVAYTASLINASGCCLTSAFIELLTAYNYPLFRVEHFRCDGAGGMSGIIAEEEVLFGTLEYMRLKKVVNTRSNEAEQDYLYVAINHKLCGMYPVQYRASRSVEAALKYLLKSSERPIFAVRDPNITPRMLKECFHTKADGFDFPPFRQRYMLSDPELGMDDPVCGVVTRSGLAPMLSITKTCKQLYQYVHLGVAASAALLLIGVLVMFWLCSANLFATGSALHLVLYELITALMIPLICHFVKK